MKRLMYLLFAIQAMMLGNGLYAAEDVPATSPAPTAVPDQGFTQTLVMIAVALLFFYIILWRPEQKRRKEMEAQRNSLKKGDRVTAMGIVGTVVRIQEGTVILKMVDGSKIEFLKAAISEVIPGNEEDEKRAEKEERTTSKKTDISDLE